MLNDIPNLVEQYETFRYLIFHIMENIEIWDFSLQLVFPKALNKSVEQIIKIVGEKKNETSYFILINHIIKFFINTIANDEKNICGVYIENFNEVVEILSTKKIQVDSEIIDKSVSMGSFGKSTMSRRYSVYFCASLFRVIYFFIFYDNRSLFVIVLKT